MSRLTNFQIRAQITSLEAVIERGRALGTDAIHSKIHADRIEKLDMYRRVLRQREAAGQNPGTHEIQQSRHGENS